MKMETRIVFMNLLCVELEAMVMRVKWFQIPLFYRVERNEVFGSYLDTWIPELPQ